MIERGRAVVLTTRSHGIACRILVVPSMFIAYESVEGRDEEPPVARVVVRIRGSYGTSGRGSTVLDQTMDELVNAFHALPIEKAQEAG